jgi:hypothetical protein
LLGNLSQQSEHRQPHLEPVRCRAEAKTERDLDGLALRSREALERAKHRPEQLLQPGERELHIGLHARRPSDDASRRLFDELLEQGCLADPRLAADNHDSAASRPDVGQ